MKRHHLLLASIVFGLTQFGAGAGAHESEDQHYDQGAALQVPRIDAVFLIDTTGSMTELIQGAKVKIWSIATKMMSARIKPEIRMALIGYRDRQDIYITRSFDFTGDIDAIYGELLKFRAEGGGDRPESVNQALDEAVNDLSWNWSPHVYRVAFLVGDSPPKMNYLDDVKYDVTARRAHKRDIIVNTLLAGGAQDTGAIWRDIARLTHGSYSEIPLSGGVQIIETPYDQDIQQLSGRLNATALPYGSSKQQEEIRTKLDHSLSAPSSVTADKMEFLKEKGVESELVTGTGELVNDLATGKVRLEELEEDALPPELQGLDANERGEVIAKRRDERVDLKNKIDSLLDQRARYLADEEAKRLAEGASDSFDREVLEAIHEQGRAKGILYE